jgi:hypothetical protein
LVLSSISSINLTPSVAVVVLEGEIPDDGVKFPNRLQICALGAKNFPLCGEVSFSTAVIIGKRLVMMDCVMAASHGFSGLHGAEQ